MSILTDFIKRLSPKEKNKEDIKETANTNTDSKSNDIDNSVFYTANFNEFIEITDIFDNSLNDIKIVENDDTKKTVSSKKKTKKSSNSKSKKYEYIKLFEKYADENKTIYTSKLSEKEKHRIYCAATYRKINVKELANEAGYTWVADQKATQKKEQTEEKFISQNTKNKTKSSKKPYRTSSKHKKVYPTDTYTTENAKDILKKNLVHNKLVYLKSGTPEYQKMSRTAYYKHTTIKDYIASLGYEWNPSRCHVIFSMWANAKNNKLVVKAKDPLYKRIKTQAHAQNLSTPNFGKMYGITILVKY